MQKQCQKDSLLPYFGAKWSNWQSDRHFANYRFKWWVKNIRERETETEKFIILIVIANKFKKKMD